MNASSQESSKSTHPLVLAAAGGVLLASLAVTGVSTGLIKTGSNADAPAAVETAGADATAQGGAGQSGAPASASNNTARVVASPAKPAVVAAAKPAAAAPCRNCGEISDIDVIKRQGEGSGLGAVAGGLAGALLGKQVGNGSGQKVATVAGAIGGAYAGNQIEKNAKADTDYRVTVRYTDGTTQQFMFDEQPAWRVGDDVRVENGRIVSR